MAARLAREHGGAERSWQRAITEARAQRERSQGHDGTVEGRSRAGGAQTAVVGRGSRGAGGDPADAGVERSFLVDRDSCLDRPS
jgi:hypothetical protein